MEDHLSAIRRRPLSLTLRCNGFEATRDRFLGWAVRVRANRSREGVLVRVRVVWSLVLVVSAGVLTLASAPPAAAVNPCLAYRVVRAGGQVPIAGINELSGLEWSTRRRVLWFHEDGNNPPRLYAVRRSGRARANIAVLNASNHDWEEMALAGNRVWIGDIGDNGRKRPEIRVYIFPEPRLGARSVRAKLLRLRYPDGAHNAEAMVVDANLGRLFIITKERDRNFADVYRANVRGLRDGVTRKLARIGRINIGNVTAADLGPAGLVVKNYRHGLLYRWGRDHRVATAIRGRPCEVAVGGGESITFSSGHRLYAIPEGTTPRIYRSLRG
jgi:hypothetical protein